MAQFRGIRVHVQSGSAVVRQIWKANGSVGGTPPFQAGEALSWTGSGVGVYVADNGVQFEFYRTSGPLPSVGLVITGGSSGATWTISSFPSENLSATAPVAAYPASFATTGGTQGAISSGDEFFIPGEPVHVVSGTIADDNFTLTGSWSGTSPLTNVEAVVNRDRTSNYGWPLVEQGSRIPFAIIKEALRQIDAQVFAGGGGGGSPPSFIALAGSLQNNWANVAGRMAAAYAYHAGTDIVELRGYIARTTGAPTTGELIVAVGGLPSGNRPSARFDVIGRGEPYSIETDGSIVYRGLGGIAPPGDISFNGVQFRADGS